MGLAILIWIIGLFIAIMAGIATKEDTGYVIVIVTIFGIGGLLSIAAPLDGVDYQIAPYSVTVDGQLLYFRSYITENRTLSIPSHYYRKIDFTNSWKRCDVPLQVDIPEGYQLDIKDNTPSPVPHIVNGGCK